LHGGTLTWLSFIVTNPVMGTKRPTPPTVNAKIKGTRYVQLEKEIKTLKQQLAQNTKPMLVPISTFAPEPYTIKSPIQVLVVPDEGSYVATLVDANINASGETVPGAVTNLKDMILRLFERLNKEPREKLGKRPARQLDVLRDLIKKKSRHASHRQTAR
jgi:hypothetical protein